MIHGTVKHAAAAVVVVWGWKRGTKVQTQKLLNCLWDGRDVGEIADRTSGLST